MVKYNTNFFLKIFYFCKDPEAFCSDDNDACETQNDFVPDPRRFGLTDDYVYVEQDWGSLFYKHMGKRSRSEAKSMCSRNGAHLPIPRFFEEKEFYRKHFGDESIWLDVENDPNEGLKTVDGHFYIQHIRSFADKSSWAYLYFDQRLSDLSIKKYDWFNFTYGNHRDSDLYDGDEYDPKAVVMANEANGTWMFAYEDELVDTVCVYNIIPDERACSICPDENFCRFARNERQETECICKNTNEGEQCEVDLCRRCQNGGFCEIDDSTNEIQCRCPYPFYGENCENSTILLLNGESSIIINSLGKSNTVCTQKMQRR